jgi:choline dehydrogenase-like flavoprotein
MTSRKARVPSARVGLEEVPAGGHFNVQLPQSEINGVALTRVNAVVVGAGAGGGIVAKEVAEAGLSVVLLERGRWYTAFDCRKDDLRNQRTSVLGCAFGPDDGHYRRVAVDPDGKERVVLPSDGAYSNNAACVGGGTFSYGAMAWRYMEKDFRMRSTYGAVEGSTLEDWPISYLDLEPYYEKAEWEIGVSGDDSNNIFRGLRRRRLPMPPLPPSREHLVLKSAAERLGLHPFDIPMLRNSVPYNGRDACMRCRWCVGFACEVDAKSGTHNTVIPKALATGNCVLKTECVVKEVLTNASGRVTGVAYFDADGRLVEQPADLVVVSASATESARLLLNSKSRLFPNGLGNRYDWVGRNLQGHAYAGAYGLMPADVYDDLGPGASIAICDYNHANPGLVGGAMLCNEFIRLPIHFAMLRPPGVPSWGAAHKGFMRDFYRRCISVHGPVQEMPVFESRLQVDPRVRDDWGIPVARLSGTSHPHNLEVAGYISEKAAAWLKESGAITTWPKLPGKGLSGGQHQAGTCRMGDDPKTSVVNKYCQVHDVDNLFVVDGSVHVTNGGFNPVLTIMAIAYFASDHIVQTWKGTRFRG